MKAIGYTKSLPIEQPGSLEVTDIPDPVPGPRDIVVSVEAISLNPVDVKVRMRAEPEAGHKVLGFDAAGTVQSVGEAVQYYKPGDQVFYAGDVTRSGTNVERHAVDERLVGKKPASLGMPESAALPLTSITAWEMLFDCFKLQEGGGEGDAILIIGGAGGVGSIMIQLAKQLTKLRVIATASRPDTIEWCKSMGADDIINHRESLVDQISELGMQPRYVAALTASDEHFDSIIELIQPRGEIGMIDDPENLPIAKIKPKALSFHWEFMFARSMFQADDMDAQRDLLNRVSQLVDDGKIKTTATRNLGKMTLDMLKEAHKLQESGTVIGKTVLEGIT